MSYMDEIHRGEALSKLLRGHGVNFSHLCKEVNYFKKGKGISRNALYDWFNDEKLSSDKILAITKAVVHLPTRHQGLVEEIEASFTDLRIGDVVQEEREKYASGGLDKECLKQIDHWRTKYIGAVEDLNAALSRMNVLQQELITLRGQNG